MELIIVIAIIVVCCLVLNVNPTYIIFGGVVFMCVFFGLMALGFAYCIINLLRSKRKEAKFLRFDKARNGKFQVAYYQVEGDEFPCVFPKEFVMEKMLYSTEKTCKVMLNNRTKKVYDRYAITTCVLGLILSIGFSVGLGVILCL